jgi:hypothetical protein
LATVKESEVPVRKSKRIWQNMLSDAVYHKNIMESGFSKIEHQRDNKSSNSNTEKPETPTAPSTSTAKEK